MRRMYSKPQLLEAVEQAAEVNGLKAFENIVDKDGHKRFIEGDITIETITGITKQYGKWSLCGTHLLIVLAVEIENGTALSGTLLAKVNLPTWIMDKIYPIISGSNIINATNYKAFASDYTSQEMSVNLTKHVDNYLQIVGSLTLTKTRTCRIGIDLLIDND